MSALPPRVVFVTRESEFEMLMQRHATREQARFFLATRGQEIEVVERLHERLLLAIKEARAVVPDTWRQAQVRRADLDRFLFGQTDIIVAIGQDGLVANLAKYLDGQPVIGLNPMPDIFDGVLVRTKGPRLKSTLLRASKMDGLEFRTMAEARLDYGPTIFALNELYIGHRSHQSARYEISCGSKTEQHSSSGVIVSTGTGATGWARSIMEATHNSVVLTPDSESLGFFVREPFPSKTTGVSLSSGLIEETPLQICSRMNEGGLIFADGIERDFLPFDWGMAVELCVSKRKLALAMP